MRKETVLRKIFMMFLALLLTISSFLCEIKADENTENRDKKTVRIGYFEDNNGFQTGFGDGERKSGYAYEYYQAIAQYTGWEYEYVYGTWSELYDMLCRGEVDVMAGISKTAEREQLFLYPRKDMGKESYFLFIPENSNAILSKDLSTINGKRIGVNENSLMKLLFMQYVKDNNISCEIVSYDGHLSCSAALDNGEIDGYVITDNYVVGGVKPIIKIGESDIYFAVAKGREDLLEDINYAQETILAATPYYNSELQQKYFGKSVIKQTLTDEEKDWLAGKKNLVVGYMAESMPYAGHDKGGQVEGLITFLQKQFQDILEIPIELEVYSSTKDVSEALKNGSIDIAFPVYGDLWHAEQEGYRLSNAFYSTQMVALYYGEYSSDIFERIAVSKNSVLQEPYARQYYDESTIVEFNSNEEALEAVRQGYATCVLIESAHLQRIYTSGKLPPKIHYVYLEESVPLCMGVSSKDTIFQTILNKALNNINKTKISDNILRNSYIENDYSLSGIFKNNLPLVIKILCMFILVIILIMAAYMYKTKQHNRSLNAAIAAAKEAEHQARTDGMTCLLNKTATEKTISESMNGGGVLFMIDLDDFKGINDIFGHKMGDELLIAFSKELKKCFDEKDVVGRFGGDEFMVFVKESEMNRQEIEDKAHRIQDIFNDIKLSSEKGAVICSASIGVMKIRAGSDESFQKAFGIVDTLLYKAKKQGKNRFVLTE